MAFTKISNQEHAEWASLRASGYTIAAIAARFGRSQETVSRSLRGLTKPIGRPKTSTLTKAEQAKKRYAANREGLIEKSKAYYRKNRRARLEYQAGQNKMVREKAAVIEQDIVKMFSLIPERGRKEYAHWLLYLAEKDRFIRQAVSGFKADSLIGAYAGV